MASDTWCSALGIDPPRLESVVSHPAANTYALLIVALLEHGAPMSLEDVARRFEDAGAGDAESALASLKRCRPARPPVYRTGELYSLDPHDDELDLWAFRLGLRPPKVPRLTVVRPAPPPLPGPDTPLNVSELDEAWKDASLTTWSAKRMVLAVLDAHGGPLAPEEIVRLVTGRTKWHSLGTEPAKFKRRDSPVHVGDDGRWAIADPAEHAVAEARMAVRARLRDLRDRALSHGDPAVLRAQQKAIERRRHERGRELAQMSRVLLAGFPPKRPRAVAMLDVGAHTLETFVDAELARLAERIDAYDIVGAEDVRGLLTALGVDPEGRRLAELGPSQKTRRLNQRGRTLRITNTLLVQGSCGIVRPFGDPKKLQQYLAGGDEPKLRRRLEADVKSLYALYEYGRLHGAARLRWGFLDERIPAPWVHRDEPMLHDLKKLALESGVPLEIVAGTAPGWSDPWSRGRLVHVVRGPSEWRLSLADEDGSEVDERDVQRARLARAV